MKTLQFQGYLYRRADYMDAVQGLQSRTGFKGIEWSDMQDLLREMGWQTQPDVQLHRDDFGFWTDGQGELESNFHKEELFEVVGHPPYESRQAVADALAAHMEQPKFKKKQPESEWSISMREPAPGYIGATSKPPVSPEPGRLYVLSFSITPGTERGPSGHTMDALWSTDESIHAEFTYGVGVPGFTVTNPQGKSTFIPESDTTNGYRVDDALAKLKFKSAFKVWLKGPGQQLKKPGLTPIRTIENTGSCPVCTRNVKLTRGGLLVDHGYQVPWQYSGRTQGCFGEGFPPYERSPKGCEAYVKALENTLMATKERLANSDSVRKLPHPHRKKVVIEPGDRDWDTAMSRYRQQLQRTIKMIPDDILRMQQRIDEWVGRPLPGER